MKDFNKELIAHASLDAIHWWIMRDYEYHNLFKQGKSAYQEDTSSYEEKFIEFSNKYSVFKFVKTTERKAILAKLMRSEFHEEVLNGKISTITDHLPLTTTLNKKGRKFHHLSMLSKYATLINPIAFRMLDQNAIWSISQLSKGLELGYKQSEWKNDFAKFAAVFEKIKSYALAQGLEDISVHHYAYVKDGFPAKPIPKEAFINRVVDKFLWHYCDRNRK
ncbi:MAG: hypothetical protein AAGA77_25280 [Bacteroidota bacterium]